jgi:hypothetical protein
MRGGPRLSSRCSLPARLDRFSVSERGPRAFDPPRLSPEHFRVLEPFDRWRSAADTQKASAA